MKQKHLLLSLLSTLVFFASCKKNDDHTPPSNNGYAFDLNLSFDENNDKVTLQWESLNVSGFQRYIIVRSLDSLPDNPEPPGFIGNNTLFFIADQEVTTFLDDFPPAVGDLYYKVYIELENRFVLSPTRMIPSESKVFPFCIVHAALLPGTDYIFISTANQKIVKYDYIRHEIVKESTTSIANPLVRVLDAGNGPEIFVFSDNDQNLAILDIADLSLKKQINLGGLIFDVAAISSKGFLIVTQRTFGNALRVLKRSDMSELYTTNVLPYNHVRKLMKLPSDDDKIYEMSSIKIAVHQINDQGVITTSSSENISFTSEVLRDVTISSLENRFIFTNQISIYNPGDLSLEDAYPFFTVSSCFDSQNNNILYFPDFSTIQSLNLSTGEITTTKDLFEVQLFLLLETEDNIISIGSPFFGSTFCSVLSVIKK